jgi:hypothetical protein
MGARPFDRLRDRARDRHRRPARNKVSPPLTHPAQHADAYQCGCLGDNGAATSVRYPPSSTARGGTPPN